MCKRLFVKKGSHDWFGLEVLVDLQDNAKVSCPCCGVLSLEKVRVLGGAHAMFCRSCGYGDRFERLTKAPVFITIQAHISKLQSKIRENKKNLKKAQQKLDLCKYP